VPEKSFSEILAVTGGTVEGPAPSELLTGVASLKEAVAGEVSFLANKKYRPHVKISKARVIIVATTFEEPPQTGVTFIRVENSSLSFAQVVNLFALPPVIYEKGIHPSAVIHPTAKIGRNVSLQPHVMVDQGAVIGDNTFVGANSYIGIEATIGQDCFIYPNVSVRERTLIGNRVILHCGAVIGSDGFGFDLESATPIKIAQVGIVQIDDDVEVGANTAIDRARFGRTWIQSGVKIDNLVQVAHNVVIKKNAIIVAQVGIAGSTIIGENVILAGQAGLAGHLEVGDKAIVTAQSGVAKDIPAGQTFMGIHAKPIREWLQIEACLHRLPDIQSRINKMERLLEQLTAQENRLP